MSGRITTLLLLLLGLPLITVGIVMSHMSKGQTIIWVIIVWIVVGGGILISRR